MMNLRNSRGSSIISVIIISAVMGLLLLTLSKQVAFRSKSSVYLQGRDNAVQLAETGMNDALARLSLDPRNIGNFNGTTVTLPDGEYQFFVEQRNDIVPLGYYIRTEATAKVGGKSYKSRLHTHVEVSNVAEYFAAIKDELVVSAGVNVSLGRIYSPILTFNTDPSLVTTVKSAQFVKAVTPSLDWSDATKARVVISEPSFPVDVDTMAKANQPVKLNSRLVFPQILDSDLVRYRKLAQITELDPVGHTKCDFTGDVAADGKVHIFPPGYTTNLDPNYDRYARHSNLNEDHVYYCNDTVNGMKVQGIVHGQVLFVSEGDIHITGNITSAAAGDLPGAGSASSSTAHQAILITPKSVVIDNTYYEAGWTTQETQSIQALIIAPEGELYPRPYLNTAIHSRLSLNFLGSLILGHLSSNPPTNLRSVFDGSAGRVYAYMESLKNNPPPYIPTIRQIHYSFEENDN